MTNKSNANAQKLASEITLLEINQPKTAPPKINVRKIRSFVKREGRLTARCQKAWDEFSKVALISSLPKRDNLKKLRFKKLIVEIGSGQGNQIVHAAQNNPETLFIGIEVYHTGVAHTLLLAKNAGIFDSETPNLKMCENDAAELLDAAEDESIDELWTFFPDPWQKKKHNKRRLVNDSFKETVLKKLKVGGFWRLATDWEDYAFQMQEVLGTKPTARFQGRVLTNFEKKGIDAGRIIYDFCLEKS